MDRSVAQSDAAAVRPTPRSPDVFIGLVALGGTAAILQSIQDQSVNPLPALGLVLTGLTLLSGIATLRMPSVAVSFSISDAFTMTAALAFGPGAGTLIVALDSLAISWRLARRALPGRQALFNATAPPLAMAIAARFFFALAGVKPLSEEPARLVQLIVPAGLFTLAYFGLNTGLIAYAVALSSDQPLLKTWRDHFFRLWLSYFAGALVAVVLVLLVYGDSPMLSILVVLVPLPVVLHAMFRTAMRRLEDQVGHLDQVNRLYQSTVETLAHAIDAKDQVTHGHIRRVQLYAGRLASALGVTDDGALRALQAAALLHDAGKLAIPEHILNKPARLSEAEFEVMKRHASIGADILAKVDFPFPVVPIVRHHHENWDGTGYPDGLKALDIPLGARILSVVDCFDALTSDRPYRRRLPDSEALAILMERRGSMYDPAVVDAFVEAHANRAFQEGEPPPEPLPSLQLPPSAHTSPAQPAAACELYRALLDLAAATAGVDDSHELCQAVHTHIGRIMPAATCVFYISPRGTTDLVARDVAGLHAAALRGSVVPVGEKLSGWVAANRAPIVNSDAALDLEPGLTSLSATPLRRCLSVPIVGGQLVGSLTLYSTLDPFSDTHAAVLAAIADRIGPTLGRSTSPRVASRLPPAG